MRISTHLLLVCVLYLSCVYAVCPWTFANLKSWSNATSWPSGKVPVAGADVVIPAGYSIILDVSPPALHSVIVDGGIFVWGNYDNLELVADAFIAKNGGQIWIGAEDCLFSKQAYITLTGSPSSANFTGFGNKVLGVGAGGTLELHGTQYTKTWTRLSSTHKPVNYKNQALGRGMNVAVFQPTAGDLIAFRSFDTFASTNNSDALVAFLNAQTTGSVVAVVAADEASNKLTPAAVTALQGIGSSKITQLKYRSGWVCIGVKGAAIGSAVEDLKNETSRPTMVMNRTFTNFVISAQTYQPYGGFIQAFPGGNPIINIVDAVNWKVGQQIVVASTDEDYTHAEQNEVLQVINSKQLKLKNPFKYTHWGNIESGVDERAEVGLLSRSIVVRGRLSSPTDTYGGHSRFLLNFTNVHIENVEFFQMGQDGVIGAYPVHFHMAFDVDQVGRYTKPAYVKGCGIWTSYNRCITIHGTSGLLVKDNVAYNAKGHCYFFEDGSEMRNTLDGNLGLSTHYGNTILSDYDPARCTGILSGFCKGPATYWIENPNNTLINNVAAGSVAFGIWYVFPSTPSGLSAPYFPTLAIPFIPLKEFRNNFMHSSPFGLMVDDGVVTTPGPTFLGIQGARYRPHALPTTNSPRVPANFVDVTVHHCKGRAIWVRGGDFRFKNVKLADNVLGITMASEGTMPNDAGSSQEMYDSLIVGVTPNNYSALFYSRVVGYEIYDGPVRAGNVTFVNFIDNRNSSAISAKVNNPWQIATTNDVYGIKFNNVFKRVYWQEFVRDGDKNNVFKDLDGSVTGRPGWSVVTKAPIHHTKRCVAYPDWNAFACPDKYGMLYIMNRNMSATNFTGEVSQVLYRDERSSNPMTLTGIGSAAPVLQFQPLVLLNKTYTLHFNHPTPPQLGIQLTNFDAQDWIRIGVCYPKTATVNVRYRIGRNYVTLTPVASLAAVNSNTNSTSTYYFDNTTGLLFVKAIAQYNRDGLNYCGIGGCESIEIAASGAGVGSASGLCAAYPKYATTEP